MAKSSATSGATIKLTSTLPLISEAIVAAIPATNLTVSAWADTYRYLAPERSARPGRWDANLVPYLREIMDAASDPAIREIIFWKSAQVAGTEFANNVIGYYIHIEPSPILYVCETEAKAKAWSQESLAPMIRDTPVLNALVEDHRSRDSGNTIEGKRFPGGHLAVAWATSAATLSSRPRRIAIFDEVDAFGSTAEGDPISLGEARTKTFPDAKIIKISTPRDDDTSRIKPAYEASYAGKYHLPCPHCGEFQELTWDRVRWEDNPLLAYYVCVSGCVIEHEEKTEMLKKGKWVFSGEKRDKIGFHIWEGYSPFVSWGQMATNFLAKKKNRDELKTFVNTSLAQTWVENDAEIDVANLPERCEDYGAEVPAGVIVLTAAADVQDNRLEYEIVGWGLDQESWSIERGVLVGDPNGKDVWERLKNEWTREFQDAQGRVFKVLAACIDSGGHHTDKVYQFCYANAGWRWYAVKGANTPGKPLISKPTMQGKPPVKLFTLGTETAKDAFAANLRVMEPGPGYCHFPSLFDELGNPVYNEAYFKQLVSEKPVIKYSRGVAHRVWQKIKPSLRNEALDCRVYACAALAILNPNLPKLAAILANSPAEKSTPARAVQSPPRGQSFMPRRPKGGGFVNGWK